MQPVIDLGIGFALSVLIVPPWILVAGLIKRRWPK